MLRFLPVVPAALILVACAGPASPAAPASPAGSHGPGVAAWARLKTMLPGTWTMPTKNGGTFTVTYKLISSGSAIVEHWGKDTEHETETVFYPDHADLLLTHYCAQGNQPRLRVTDMTEDAVVFRFVDVTNREPDQEMLVEQTLRFTSDGGLEDTEVYRATDGSDDTTTYRFTRATL
jgi:hypothetical protein